MMEKNKAEGPSRGTSVCVFYHTRAVMGPKVENPVMKEYSNKICRSQILLRADVCLCVFV